ncbi:PEP-CTERM sorting domain-containing protein [Reinekea marinisedimentorum]|uniref:Putative secreted protein with PEP-CTERM sorting signal n=1 Tax=Reinekea marinisedimentorum TaxID=230495 RepID=A0A4V2UKB4_9GAMM|nr:PEP-CTERM sorting domain-containing protein [Reinekea marinisedimentorum]TCS43673.1 putative secreted protein with PEP-CTERM sorting signal [Reinekea marinisedimentorum]
MTKLVKAGVIALVTLFSIGAHANLITNGSFEANDVDSINNNGGSSWEVFESIDGWTTYSGAGIEIQTNDTLSKLDTPFGDQYVELDSANVFRTGRNTNSLMAQEVTGLTVGSYYELSYWYMPRTSTTNDNGINVYWWADGDAVNNSIVADAVANSVFYSGIDWEEITSTLLATAETMYLGFGAFGRDNAVGGLIDNVTLVEVPEPATLALFAIGLIGLGAARRANRSEAVNTP